MDHDHIYKSESHTLRGRHNMSTAGAQLLVDLRVRRSQRLVAEQAEVSARNAFTYHFMYIFTHVYVYYYALIVVYGVCTSMHTSTTEATT